MRILILRGGALGDLIVTLPAIAALRAHWPDARIELVGNSSAAQLALSRGLIDAAHSQHEARWAALYGISPLRAELATWLGTFDLVINYWPDPEKELAQRFPIRSDQIFLTAMAQPISSPAASHYCTPLQQIDLEPEALVYPLRQPTPDRTLVALHPGSGSAKKNWPMDRWRTLARWLEADLRLSVLVISGEGEPADILEGVGVHLRSRPLDELADRLACCRLFIGHDSGISHLAASAGVPCVLLFGPTDPSIWAPPASTVQVIQRGAEMSAISLPDVQAAVTAALRDRN